MNRRGAGLADRHALLSAAAYPSSSRSASPSLGLGASRSASPFENPYGGGQGSSYVRAADPYDEYEVAKGAPKKEPRYSGGAALGGGIASRIAAYGSQRTAEDLEGQNDEKLEGLSAKVKMLKDITVGIGNEVRDSTKDLSTMNDAFSNTSAFLGNTFKRMNRMADRQGSTWCSFMMFMVFVIWIFVFVWWWRR